MNDAGVAVLDTPEATVAAGRRLGAALREGDVLGLTGAIGAGLRSLHTLKGMAGFLGLDGVMDLCHAAEELLHADLAETTTMN